MVLWITAGSAVWTPPLLGGLSWWAEESTPAARWMIGGAEPTRRWATGSVKSARVRVGVAAEGRSGAGWLWAVVTCGAKAAAVDSVRATTGRLGSLPTTRCATGSAKSARVAD
ncbi:hypothetical protein ACWGE0_24535 [Lentzea sp. NPDC054927]